MLPPRLRRLKFSGITSLRDVEIVLETPTTILIGANGAGKSNLVGALELVSRILDAQLQESVAHAGGFDRLLHVTPRGEDEPDAISLELWGDEDDAGIANGYRANLSASEDDEAVLRETVLMHDAKRYARPYTETLSAGRETRLTRDQHDSRMSAFISHVQPLVAGIRVYHFDDVGQTAPSKKIRPVGDNLFLHSDAGNLAPYLLRLREEHREGYTRLLTVIRNVAPFFDDFVLVPTAQENIRLRWRQQGLGDAVFNASQLSDGTLRFICLATLLLSPDAPRVIVLDEPELGLHPHAITQLAALIRQATLSGRQAIIATQSTLLLDQFPLESVAVLDRRDGATTVSRPDASALEAFVEEYTLSDLWQMNLLAGGQPTWEDGRA